MKNLLRSAVLALLLAVGALVISPSGPATTGWAAGSALNLDAEKTKGEKIVQTLGIQEALGPLAPVALSPFFALTCLSGASLLADSGLVPDFVASNPIMGTSSVLNNGFVFAGLLGLSLVTAVPKLTKVTKPLAQAVDQIEANAGIVSVVAVQFLSQMNLGGGGEPETAAIIYQAGLLSFTSTTLIAVFSAINIFVVNTVKFFFEVLIFLSPFPGVDAAFEAANKGVAALLVSVYVFSPWLATGINLVIFFFSLLIFAWAFRRVIYMKAILGDPVLGWIAEGVFRRRRATLTSTPLPHSIAKQLRDPRIVLKAFSDRSFQGLRVKTRGYLVSVEDGLCFAESRFLRAPLIVKLPRAGHSVEVSQGFLSNSVRFRNDAGETAMKVLFTRRYNDLFAEIQSILGATAEEQVDLGGSAVAASRAIGAAIKGDGRDAIRAELG